MCLAYFIRWYFDKSDKTCKSFVFGGCNGNDNNYNTEQECLLTCGNEGEHKF